MQHFRSIHYLRAVAAIMVAVFHIFSGVDFMRADVAKVMWLRGGVDIFFVISGFVMVQSTAGRQVTPAQFIGQRVLRIVPMYWLATLAVMLQVDGESLFKAQSLFFIPAINPKSEMMQPILEPGWTLNYEMFFYAFFAAALLLKESRRLLAVASGFGVLVLFGIVTDGSQLSEFYARPIILEFVFGMAIAHFGVRLPVIAVPAGFAVMFALQYMTLDRVFTLGIPAAMIVAGALRYEGRLPQWKWAEFLGSASYSIYLFHLLALGFIVQLWPQPEAGKAMFAAGSAVFMVLTGCGIYWALERPFLALTKSGKNKRREQRLAPAGQPINRKPGPPSPPPRTPVTPR